MRGTWQNWNSVWLTGVLVTTTLSPWPICYPLGVAELILQGVATTRVPAASRDDSRFQAILKFQPLNSFNYRVRYVPQLVKSLVETQKLKNGMHFFNRFMPFKVLPHDLHQWPHLIVKKQIDPIYGVYNAVKPSFQIWKLRKEENEIVTNRLYTPESLELALG